MGRAHSVAYTSRICTTYLTFDSLREARAAIRAHYTTRFYTLVGIEAAYAGKRKVRRHAQAMIDGSHQVDRMQRIRSGVRGVPVG